MELSIEDLRNSGTSMRIAIDLQFFRKKSGTYKEFVSLINSALDYSSSEMAKDKNVIKGMNEDQLTNALLKPLRTMAFDADHATNVGGNCDIIIKGPFEMLWLGEAKKFSAYDKILGGFQQLTDRYSTGLPNQDHGSLIIYMTKGNAVGRMKVWQTRLKQHKPSITITYDASLPLEFTSISKHAGSGLPLTVRHIPIVVFHEPTDPRPRKKTDKKAKD